MYNSSDRTFNYHFKAQLINGLRYFQNIFRLVSVQVFHLRIQVSQNYFFEIKQSYIKSEENPSRGKDYKQLKMRKIYNI